MNVLILAAGFSTRLKPLTNNFPKGLLKIKGEEIILGILKKITNVRDFQDFTLVTNKVCYHHFSRFLDSLASEKKIEVINNGVSDEKNRLGAIGDLILALESIGMDEDLLVLPSDTLVSLDFEKLLHFYNNHHGFINVVFDAGDKEIIREKLGCAELDGDKLVSFEEKPKEPKSTFQSVPIYIYPKEVLPLIIEYATDPKNNLDSPGAIVPYLIGKVPTFAYQIKDGYYHDVGTLEVFEKLNKK
ncbi:MAG: sugar phosphate nucleotidyltransferase [Candidatus Pacebacteria bacterium]|nr:sugar phosphate nucleotidyltransferase [Candidatus Paceibacterota bacterium]